MMTVKASKRKKNPILSAFFSIIPGLGAIYNGTLLKAAAQMLLFALFIILAFDAPKTEDGIVFSLFIAGFYIYQILDNYNEALDMQKIDFALSGSKSEVSLFWALLILVLGIVFQLANFNCFSYGDVFKFWPLLLILFGGKILFLSTKKGIGK